MISTSRCRLRKLDASDYANVFRLYNDMDVRKYLGGTVSVAVFAKNFEKMCSSNLRAHHWTVRLSKNCEFVGLFSLDVHHNGIDIEASYQILPNYWGTGIAVEVLEKIIDYGFSELKLQRMLAETQMNNIASRKLLEKIGMKLENVVQRFGAVQGIYAITHG